MTEERRVRGAATLLILLAMASFAAAAVTITNITEWYVNARTPPIVKRKGDSLLDTGYIDTSINAVYADWDGTNRTVIVLTAFTGDPTEYTEVIKICNKDTVTYKVKLVYQGLISNYNWDYIWYVKIWLSNKDNYIDLRTADVGAATDWIEVSGGACVSVGAEILVDANAPTDTTVVGFRIDVVSQTPP